MFGFKKVKRIKPFISASTPDAFNQKNYERVRFYETQFTQLKGASSAEKSVDIKIQLLEQHIQVLHEFQQLCLASKGGTLYFNQMWGSPDIKTQWGRISYIDKSMLELDDLKMHYADYKTKEAEYFKCQCFVQAQGECIISFIYANPGILQTDVYKQFGEENKAAISDVIYQACKAGRISKVKDGRTNRLYMA